MENQADRQEKLKNAMSKAKKLIQLESNGTLDRIAKGAREGVNTSLTDDNVTTSRLMTTARNMMTEAPMVGGAMGENAMNVPAAIRESFARQTIDSSNLQQPVIMNNNGLSFLSEERKASDVRQIVKEGMNNTQQVDYPMIRTIVEEIVRKYSISLKNKIINEGKNNEINTISFGKTFKFLDNSGNIYECTMKKIGNINNKKKSVNE